MKKSFLIILCVLLVLSFALVACGDKEEEPTEPTNTEAPTTDDGDDGDAEHTHTFDKSKWESDKDGHWYAASCEHKTEKANAAKHVDENNDGICDVCKYVSCTHTYAEAWSTDTVNHWHAPSCGHKVDNKDTAQHKDADKDGLCDTCAYKICAEHKFDTKWTSDAKNHWNASTCGCAVKQNEAAHKGMEDGICDVCAYGKHEHKWFAEAKYDSTNHWNETICTEHAAYKENAVAHADENKDGVCDGCAYKTCPAHTYETTWSYDDNGHFHAATCGCAIANKDTAPHDTLGAEQSCSVCGFTDHEHTYSSGYYSHSEKHWKEYTCGCSGRYEEADHDGMEDGICDTCNSGEHTHTVSWVSKDGETHYQATTCTFHPEVVLSEGEAHTDINFDSKCDRCPYEYPHTHTYDTENWSSDLKGHWHANTCGCNAELVRIDYALHDMEGENDACSVCGATNAFAEAVDEGIANSDKVNGGNGTMTSKNDYDYPRDGAFDSENDVITNTNIAYLFGPNFTYVKKELVEITDVAYYDYTDWTYVTVLEGATLTDTEEWYHTLTDDGVFSLLMTRYHYVNGDFYLLPNGENYSQDTFAKNSDAAENGDDMKGFKQNLSELTGYDYTKDDVIAYGVEDFVYQLLNYALTNELVGDIKSSVDGNTYTFSFMIVSGSSMYGNLREIEVTFTMDNGVIKTAKAKMTEYLDPTDDPTATAADGYDYYINDEDGTVIFFEGALVNSEVSFSFTQTVGERTATTPAGYGPEDVIYTEYDAAFQYKNDNDETVTVVDGGSVFAGTSLTFVTANQAPTHAGFEFDVPEITILCDGETAYNYVHCISDVWDGVFTFRPRIAGVFEITIETENLTKVITVNSVARPVTEINAIINDSIVASKEIMAGQTIEFTAEVNEYADGAFTATATGGTLALSETADGYYTFSADKAGEYTINIKSTVDSSVTTTLVVTVKEPPKVEDVLVGTYKGTTGWSQKKVTVEFKPTSTGATSGVMNVTAEWGGGARKYELIGSYNYAFADGEFTTTLIKEEVFRGGQLQQNFNNTLVVTFDTGSFTVVAYDSGHGMDNDGVTLKAQSSTGGDPSVVNGDWDGPNYWWQMNLQDGEGVIVDTYDWTEYAFTYTVEGSNIIVSGTDYIESMTIIDETTLSVVIMGSAYDFTYWAGFGW